MARLRCASIAIVLALGGCAKPGPSAKDLAIAHAQQDALTRLCFDAAHESIKRFPKDVRKIYLSTPSTVVGDWDFELFFGLTRPKRWADAELVDGAPPGGAVREPGSVEVRYTHLPVTREVAGATLRFDGVRQEVIDLGTGEVVAERENYIWGRDFNRAWFCLGTDWFRGNDGFVDRVLGHRYRDESPQDPIPETYVKARAVGSVPVDVRLKEHREEDVLPAGWQYVYNDRKIVLPDGSRTPIPTYRNQEVVRILASLRDGPGHVLVLAPGGAVSSWPLRQLMLLRLDAAGRFVAKVYVQLPTFVDWSVGWGFSPQDIALDKGELRIGIYGNKVRYDRYLDGTNFGQYRMRYDFVAALPE